MNRFHLSDSVRARSAPITVFWHCGSAGDIICSWIGSVHITPYLKRLPLLLRAWWELILIFWGMVRGIWLFSSHENRLFGYNPSSPVTLHQPSLNVSEGFLMPEKPLVYQLFRSLFHVTACYGYHRNNHRKPAVFRSNWGTNWSTAWSTETW